MPLQELNEPQKEKKIYILLTWQAAIMDWSWVGGEIDYTLTALFQSKE